ncbi:MAG: hypothetical protein CMJ23_03925 [Phycisphaerae bacterium]|mgnify:CR=1 FL=1|nr:hypothetical protein [Phycisphaerae bacterium]
MPWSDWQFWVVTLMALGGVILVVRPLLPTKRPSGRCGTCPSGTNTDEAKGQRTPLTIEGRRTKQSRRSSSKS